jgi:hypothetical protein
LRDENYGGYRLAIFEIKNGGAMGKILNPATLSTEFGIEESTLAEFGVVNVLLATDTLLFIDPMLLLYSQHPEIHDGAVKSYNSRFEQIIQLLAASKARGDVAWRAAERLFHFSEISWTCLGYGTSVRGSGFGAGLITTTLETAAQIVSLGVTEVDLFMALALFEEGIGPDRISDMTTNIILKDLISFTHRINSTLKLKTRRLKLGNQTVDLIPNPYSKDPIIFVPRDIVRALPIATDWSDISRVVAENDELRERVNNGVGQIWATMTRDKKRALKNSALQSQEKFESLLAMLREVNPAAYNFDTDKNGENFWIPFLETISQEFPFDLTKYSKTNLDIRIVEAIVKEIVMQFQDLVENKGLWKELWAEDDQPRKEKASQRLFYVIAHSYCKANNLDVTPEADAGNGPVDFKISKGFDSKVVVEIKLSTNPDVIHGYEKQLEIYKKADDTDRAIFLLIDVGKMGKKYDTIQRIRNDFLQEYGHASDIIYVDGNQKASASKRK